MIDPKNLWLLITLVLAVSHWVARWKGMSRVGAATKLPVTAALILWSLSEGGWPGGMGWIGAGLVFSLIGDLMLLLPRRFFIPGLTGFLLAHICYIIGFSQPGPVMNPILFVITCLLFIYGYFYFQNLRQSWKVGASGNRFITPFVLYGITLCLMTLSACQTILRADWPPTASCFAAAGGILFLFSDSLLGYNRFIHPLPGGRTFEMMTYHLAQIAIVAASLIRW